MTVFYEEKSITGRWMPRTAPSKPQLKSYGGIIRTQSCLRRVRAVQIIPKDHRHLTLDQLAACYSPSGQFRHSTAQ